MPPPVSASPSELPGAPLVASPEPPPLELSSPSLVDDADPPVVIVVAAVVEAVVAVVAA